MIRRAVHSGSRALGRLAEAVSAATEVVTDFFSRAWRHHSELMEESIPYRQQLALVITTALGLLRLHPSFTVLAAALGALYVAAYQRRSEPVYERPADKPYRETDWRSGDGLRPTFHDRW